MSHTIGYGLIPQETLVDFRKNPQWHEFEKDCLQKPTVDERLKIVLQRCLEDNLFKEEWERVRVIFGCYPHLVVADGDIAVTKLKECTFLSDKGYIRVQGYPRISLPVSHFPALSIMSLANKIFELSDKDIVLAKMSIFCFDAKRFELEQTPSEYFDLDLKIGGLTLSLKYTAYQRTPEFGIE